MSRYMNQLSQMLSQKIPSLKSELKDAQIDADPIQYISESIVKSGLASALTFALSVLAFSQSRTPSYTIPVMLSVLSFFFCLFIAFSKPSQIIQSRSKMIEKSLIYSLHAINIELESGTPLMAALQNISEKDYGQFSKEMGWIVEKTQKYGLSKALEMSSERNKSKIFSRAMWQLINSLETGADLTVAIKSIIRELKKKQEMQAQRFGRSMEKQMTLYVMGAIVFPALSVILLQVISTFGLAKDTVDEGTYWSILIASVIVQAIFFFNIKFTKPTLVHGSILKIKSGGFIEHMRETHIFCGHKETPPVYWIKKMFEAVLIFTILSYFAADPLGLSIGRFIIYSTAVYLIGTYAVLMHKVEKRAEQATSQLPDLLRMTAANIKSGISIDQALFMSSKKQGTLLAKEIRILASDVMKNLTFEQGLKRLKLRIKSEPLHLCINLIMHGIRSGQGLAEPLYHISDILEDRQYVLSDIKTHLHSIKTTILILVVFSAPLLYGCSIVAGHKMSMFSEKLASSMPQKISDAANMGFTQSKVDIRFLENYVLLSLIASSIFAALIISELSTGRADEAIRYMLILSCSSVTLYVLIRAVIEANLSGVLV